MRDPYYKIPLRLDTIIQKRQHEYCSLEDSIAQNLDLIFSTYQGESAYDNEYGCSLWDEEFNIKSNIRWKEDLCDSLKKAISKFESRLEMKEIKASMKEENELLGKERLRIRKSLTIEIQGIIKKTNEPFAFRDRIFISPVSHK